MVYCSFDDFKAVEGLLTGVLVDLMRFYVVGERVRACDLGLVLRCMRLKTF